ncbi:hypothetical protein CTAYLR_000950 [Chrysophaeum taylorii]|uniref:Flavin-containing monooxygenase n=1 Tax=Chrysophaeum taylorii TaxID=2483200 RepID=A0AAD7UH60_9STRA|nr:hypothetical protein CTAYLR_000950 [Chrysophaeum taylorii]
MGKRVAIVGAGPGGLVAAKECLAAGLEPKVFEKSGRIGGVWAHGMWRSMRANLSKHTCSFSDFGMRAASEFPSPGEMVSYLEEYATRFGVRACLALETEVVEVRRRGERWRVATRDGCEEFDYLCVACGIFGSPWRPNIPGAERVKQLHAREYRGDVVAGDALVVGSAFSGAEIAADLASKGVRVACSGRTAHYYLPRLVGSVPVDLVFFDPPPTRLPTLEERHAALRKLAFDSAELLSPDTSKSPKLVISDSFVQFVDAGAIACRSELARFEPRDDDDAVDAVFADGRRVAVHTVIWATGYDASGLATLLPMEVLRDLEFDQFDKLQPLVLHLQTIHPSYPSLGFVGYYRGPYFGAMELQARLLAAIWSGAMPAPSREEQWKGCDEARRVRRGDEPGGRAQFPVDYVAHTDALARALGVGLRRGPISPSFPLRLVAYLRSVWVVLGARWRRSVCFAHS